jgi:hypothetical protein
VKLTKTQQAVADKINDGWVLSVYSGIGGNPRYTLIKKGQQTIRVKMANTAVIVQQFLGMKYVREDMHGGHYELPAPREMPIPTGPQLA